MEEIQTISKAIRDFETYVRHGVINGRIRIYDLLDVFKEIQPSLHPYVSEDNIIDIGALIYSTKRLPNNISSMDTILVKRRVPENFGRYEGITEVSSDVKRRETYQISDSEIIMVVREDVSDILDLVTILCSFVIEASKVKAKLIASGLVEALEEVSPTQVEMPGFTISHDAGLSVARKNQLFTKLAFELGITEEEIMELDGSWKGKLMTKMFELARHDHDITVKVHSSITSANLDNRAREWCQDILDFIQEKGLEGRPVHIISSNTHSIVNCVSGFVREPEIRGALDEMLVEPENSEILQTGRALAKGQDTDDLRYYFLRNYLSQAAKREKEFKEYQAREGIYFLPDRRYTGIPVQLIDVAKLDLDKLDSRIPVDRELIEKDKPFLLNFEYAFGAQAEKIIGVLCEEFNERIRSISIMGKAGTLVGHRGCIMLPSYFLNYGRLDVYDLVVPNGITKEDLECLGNVMEIFSGGPMLTVLGTILQNNEMLRFYADKWRMMGLEMEGVPYFKKLKQSAKLGYFDDGFELNVAYYASDCPLRKGETLSRGLGFEGVVPSYAITIGFLGRIFDPKRQTGKKIEEKAAAKPRRAKSASRGRKSKE